MGNISHFTAKTKICKLLMIFAGCWYFVGNIFTIIHMNYEQWFWKLMLCLAKPILHSYSSCLRMMCSFSLCRFLFRSFALLLLLFFWQSRQTGFSQRNCKFQKKLHGHISGNNSSSKKKEYMWWVVVNLARVLHDWTSKANVSE